MRFSKSKLKNEALALLDHGVIRHSIPRCMSATNHCNLKLFKKGGISLQNNSHMFQTLPINDLWFYKLTYNLSANSNKYSEMHNGCTIRQSSKGIHFQAPCDPNSQFMSMVQNSTIFSKISFFRTIIQNYQYTMHVRDSKAKWLASTIDCYTLCLHNHWVSTCHTRQFWSTAAFGKGLTRQFWLTADFGKVSQSELKPPPIHLSITSMTRLVFCYFICITHACIHYF